MCAADRFLNGVAKHPDLQTDPSFVDFLEVDSDLPRATSTSALSGAGVLRLFSRVGDSLGKMTYKMDESDTVITVVSIVIYQFQLRKTISTWTRIHCTSCLWYFELARV